MTNSGSAGSGGDDESPVVKWWKRPTVVAAVTTVATGVIAGWLQQGGLSLISSFFEDDNRSSPTVTVSTEKEAACTTWRLHDKAPVVARELRDNLGDPTSAGSSDRLSKILDEVRKSTGSELATGQWAKVTIQGKKGAAVVLTGLDVAIKKNLKDPGTLMFVGSGCGGAVTERIYEADLDAPRPKFKIAKINETGEQILKPVDFPYKVSSVDPEVFILNGISRGFSEWTAKLHWVSEGKEGVTEIDDDGKPFLSFPEAENHWFDTYTNTLKARGTP
ncbi:hypothetical protein [Streptomyces dioscori]|uniref:hypothetical protein n=1 Tax=Streptomyces dioscori TaxID=2109333 RepID=UPI00131CE10C|nr:hypothetical protein [Streptomyces dioscori]